jgi:hypothetical protein
LKYVRALARGLAYLNRCNSGGSATGHALKVKHPIYFISKILANAKTRYPQVQKLLYTVLIAKRKLRHYFESHSVMVVTSFPLGEWTETQMPPTAINEKYWMMYFISPLGVHMNYVVRVHFPASNNVAEYEALINGLRIAIELDIR